MNQDTGKAPTPPNPEDPGMVVDEQVEARLAKLTEWVGSTAGPLDRALAATGNAAGVLARIGLARRFTGGELAAMIAVGAVGIVVVAATLPSAFNSEQRRVGKEMASAAPDRAAAPTPMAGYALEGLAPLVDEGAVAFDSQIPPLPEQASVDPRLAGGREAVMRVRVHDGDERVRPDQATAARQIIRRAAVDVVATDVQLAFRAAQDLIKPERTEFIQESVLTGSGKAMSGRVTLRIAPERLGEAMQAARGLGELAAEQTGGDDVTDQLVDLEARIRNEQRVEKEMLELFDLRKDSPLKDVLELREQLARVRATIESLQGQKEHVSRLVALASLVITIRPQADVAIAKPVVNETPSFGARVSKEVGDSWTRGTTNLAESAGWIVRTAVGGLPVWLILGGSGWLVWRAAKRRRAHNGAERAG